MAMVREWQFVRQWHAVGDALTGLCIWLLAVGALSAGAQPGLWEQGGAEVSSVAEQAVLLSAGFGLVTENAGVGAPLFSTVFGDEARHLPELAILGLTFSLVFAFNMTLVRHVRRIHASPRTGDWERTC